MMPEYPTRTCQGLAYCPGEFYVPHRPIWRFLFLRRLS